MWEGGRNNNPLVSNFHAITMHGIHVLLVDHDPEALIYTAKQLEMCQYKGIFVRDIVFPFDSVGARILSVSFNNDN